MTILEVKDLSKSFGGLNVLTGVSFSVEQGEKLALIGPNGAGKSTLLNVIGGQLPASGGEVLLEGRPITKLASYKRLHLGLGRSYQVNNLFFHQSAMDNMLLALYGAEKSHTQMWRALEQRKHYVKEAERLLDTVGLRDVRSVPLHTLSYGDQRLVELLVAYAAKPRVVLLDEPSAGLPTAEATAFAEVVRTLSAEATVIFCAHDMDLVFNLADQIMVLYDGEILTKGTPEQISSDPKVREIYLGGDESC